jgi:hypothetical protein
MLHSDFFPEYHCDGKLIELPERCRPTLTVTRCDVCWTEFSWTPDDSNKAAGFLSPVSPTASLLRQFWPSELGTYEAADHPRSTAELGRQRDSIANECDKTINLSCTRDLPPTTLHE